MPKQILVYSTPICPWCEKLKEFLKQHKIKFKEINVAEDRKAAEEMIKKSGQTGVPVIEIKKAHGVGIIVGFDEEKIKQALDIK